MSAPGVQDWLPSSSKSSLTRIELGKMIIDPRPFPKRFGRTNNLLVPKERAEGRRM